MGQINIYETRVLPYLDEVAAMFANGYSRAYIAERLGISVNTLNKWCSEKKEMREIVKDSKKQLEIKLMDTKVKLAFGYEYTEEKHTTLPDGTIKHQSITKHVAPNLNAINQLLEKYSKQNYSPEAQLKDANIAKLTVEAELLRMELEERKGEKEKAEMFEKFLVAVGGDSSEPDRNILAPDSEPIEQELDGEIDYDVLLDERGNVIGYSKLAQGNTEEQEEH